MSRIGNTPLSIPQNVTVESGGASVLIKGAKGQLSVELPPGVTLEKKGEDILVHTKGGSKDAHALHGMVRATLANAVHGVTEGWKKTLELSGVGYRVALEGPNVSLSVGFSHPVVIVPPPGIIFTVLEGKIIVSGIDKYLVGQTAANIREVKKPEPYKGKGIRYEGEYIRKKAGKSAKAVGGAPGAK